MKKLKKYFTYLALLFLFTSFQNCSSGFELYQGVVVPENTTIDLSSDTTTDTPVDTPVDTPIETPADLPANTSEPTIALEASRLTGVAPLAVSFNATGTTMSGVDLGDRGSFSALEYRFNFDDSGSGVWAFSGLSKNEQTGGPIAAHVFDSPGTYNVSLTVSLPGTAYVNTKTITITVTDPDTVYSGNNTVVISMTNSTGQHPPAAQVITNATSWPSFESGKRYYLLAGQDYRSLGNLGLYHVQDLQLLKLGSGDRPRVLCLFSNNTPQDSNWTSRTVIQGIHALSTSTYHPTNNLLIYGCKSDRTMSVGTASSWYATSATSNANQNVKAAMTWPLNTFIVENEIIDPEVLQTGESKGAGITGFAGRGSAWMGNNLRNMYSHTIRVYFGHKAFFGHNKLRTGQNPNNAQQITTQGLHFLKLHGVGVDTYSDYIAQSPEPFSKHVVISNNVFGDSHQLYGNQIFNDQKRWAVTLSPENSSSHNNEGLEDIIFENNIFDEQYQLNVALGARRVTIRGNSTLTNQELNIGNGHTPPAEWQGPYFLD